MDFPQKGTPEYKTFYRKGQKNAKGQTICGAPRSNKQPCGVTFLMENGRCKNHGGKTPKGTASPHFKHGRYSKYIPAVLLDRFNEGLQDDEIHDLTEEINLVRTRLKQLLGRTDTGLSAHFITDVRKQWGRLKRAIRASDAETIGEAIDELDILINAAHQDYAAWGDMDKWLGRLQTLLDGKRKHEVETQQMMSLRQAESFFLQLQMIIAEELAGHPQLRANIADRVRQLDKQSQSVIEGEFTEV